MLMKTSTLLGRSSWGAKAKENIKWNCIMTVSPSINRSLKKMLLIKSIILFNILQIKEERLLSEYDRHEYY